MLKFMASGLLMGSLVGCAGVSVTPLKDKDAPGVRYYKPEPYLLVGLEVSKSAATAAQSSSPVYTARIIYLPNYNEGYSVVTNTGLGTADGSVKLNEGWQLTEQGAKVDSKIPEIITAVGGLAKDIIPAVASTQGFDSSKETVRLEPGLYRLISDSDGHYIGYRKVLETK